MKQLHLRASGYRRVSMREQVDGYSLDAQANSIQKFMADQGWEFVEMYTDAGISAKRGSHRPALARLMQDAQAGKFDVVVVDKIDRFYRYLNGLLTALDTLNQSGVSFASVREKLDFTTPWGKLMLTVLGMLAEIYIDNLRQETRKGLHQRARNGFWNGSIPFGYCSGICSQCTDPNGKDYCPEFGKPDISGNNILIAHPVESEAVRMAFQSYMTGEFSDAKITEKLNASHIETPDGIVIPFRQKGKPGRSQPSAFRKDTVRDMLNRVFYTGKVPYYGVNKSGKKLKRKEPAALYPGQHPAIIDEDTFDAVQELRLLLSTNPRSQNGHKVRIFPLTGILRCGYCGLSFRGVSNNGRRYYRDVTHIEHIGECPQSLLVAENIENQVADYLRKSVQDTDLDTRMKNVQRQIEEAETRFDRAKELYLIGELCRDRFEAERILKEDIADKILLDTCALFNLMLYCHASTLFVNMLTNGIVSYQ